jgi:hypothetical protein
MTEEITIEVSDVYKEMLDEITVSAGEQQVRQQTETFIHNLYQEVQAQKAQQQFAVEEQENTE